jgi:hypothetical protein
MKNIIEHVIFSKYTIDNGVIRNKKEEPMAYSKSKGGYNKCTVYDDSGKTRNILVGRAIASTFIGPPPTLAHTVDHEDKNRGNDTLENIRWLDKTGQQKNQDRPETYKSAFIVVKDGIEKTSKEWVENLKGEKNSFGRDYTDRMIQHYAQNKQHGFAYKEYPDIPDEIWKEIIDSKNGRGGRWEISNMKRVKYITKYAENVLSGEHLCRVSGYPTIGINGKSWYCHVLSFMTFFPDEYANKKPDEMILHEDDDPLDFRPHKLRLGIRSDNTIDAYNNGKYDGTKSARMKCASYIEGMFEKEHSSQQDAAKYLRHIGYENAFQSRIGMALNGKIMNAYGRVWKNV